MKSELFLLAQQLQVDASGVPCAQMGTCATVFLIWTESNATLSYQSVKSPRTLSELIPDSTCSQHTKVLSVGEWKLLTPPQHSTLKP